MPPNADSGGRLDWHDEVEQLLGIRHNDMHFWREYHTNAYLHAAITVLRQRVIELSPTTRSES